MSLFPVRSRWPSLIRYYPSTPPRAPVPPSWEPPLLPRPRPSTLPPPSPRPSPSSQLPRPRCLQPSLSRPFRPSPLTPRRRRDGSLTTRLTRLSRTTRTSTSGRAAPFTRPRVLCLGLQGLPQHLRRRRSTSRASSKAVRMSLEKLGSASPVGTSFDYPDRSHASSVLLFLMVCKKTDI